MKKLLLILIVMLVWAGNSRAQVSTYLFSSSTGTYTEITDGTVLTTSADDDNFDANDIGFTFTYNGVPYTQFSVNNNGFIAMGETVISNTSALSSGLNNNVIAPQSEDLQTNTTGAELSYQLSGSSPNQVLTIQWKNYRHYNATGESYNFQIKLYETTNVIQFVYGSYTKNTTTRTAQVGLRGASNDDFNNRATTTDWTATTAGATNTASCDLSPTVYPPSGLTFTFTPATCFAPSGLNVSDISTVEATIAWTAAIPAPANGYEYEIRTSGDVGSGPAGLVATGSTAAGDVDDDVSGLTPGGTQHYLYVRSVCGEEDYSNWALTTFTTSCANITSYPYTQSFASVLDSCWSSVSEDAEGASYHWAVTTNDASHGVSGPQEGTHFAFLNVYNAETSYNPYYLKTLAFELGETPKQVKYYYYLGDEGYTDSPVPLTLQISNDNGSTWTDLYLHTEANSTFSSTSDLSGWYLNTVNLSAYANQTVIFRFASNSYYSYGYCNQGIDEFTVEEVPACPQPSSLKATNINNNSADLGWTETGTATLWNIELGAPGFTPGTGTNLIGVTGTTSNPWPATGGSGNTTYEFYVQADCGGDVSSWAGPYSFTTLCDAVTSYPWTENFDTMNTIGNSIIPLCWTIESASGTPWASANAASNTYNDPATTPNYITCYWSPTSSNKYLITPGFNMTTGNSYNISFNYVGDGNSGWNVDVGYNTAQTGTDYSILGDAILSGETSSTSYETLTRTFYPSTSGTYYFVVRISNNYTPNYFGLDDFMVTETPVPTPVITSIEDTAGCVGSALVIHGTDLTGATDVTIGGTAAEITGNTDTTVTVTVGTGTTGTVEVTTPGGTASSTQTFTVNQLPQLFVVSGGGEYCQGGTGVVINLSGSMNGVNYDLSTTPVTTIEGTGSALTFGPTAFSTGTYTITATDTLTGCSALMTDSANVVVNPLPSDVTANASSNSICIGDTINLFSSANSNVYNTVNYFEGFEVLPPAGWTSYNEGLGNDWGAIDVSHSGNLSMFYHYSDEPADAWGITGPMALDAGTTYTISFWYMVESDYYPEKLKVTVGDAATVLAQTTTLWDNNGDTALFNETWEQAVISFNPVTSGTYYF
ncbi:MAG: carbohydrate binding domain-containing protein, partial [Bacteroidales bacterium]|nr:carbohydrate binding domain-containing protein [Bacteroidales bacterium]